MTSVAPTTLGGPADPELLSVVELSRQVLVESKKLADLVNQEGTTEDSILEAAKVTAWVTSQLIANVESCLPPTPSGSAEEQALQNQLSKQSKDIRQAILDLISSTKDALLNPFDFQFSQKLQICCSTVASTIKDSIDHLTVLRRLQRVPSVAPSPRSIAPPSRPPPAPPAAATSGSASSLVTDSPPLESNPEVEPLVCMPVVFAKQLSDMALASAPQNEFVDTARRFALALSTYIESVLVPASLHQYIDPVKESAQNFLFAAKLVYKNPVDANHRQQLDLAREKLDMQVAEANARTGVAAPTASTAPSKEHSSSASSSADSLSDSQQLVASYSPPTTQHLATTTIPPTFSLSLPPPSPGPGTPQPPRSPRSLAAAVPSSSRQSTERTDLSPRRQEKPLPPPPASKTSQQGSSTPPPASPLLNSGGTAAAAASASASASPSPTTPSWATQSDSGEMTVVPILVPPPIPPRHLTPGARSKRAPTLVPNTTPTGPPGAAAVQIVTYLRENFVQFRREWDELTGPQRAQHLKQITALVASAVAATPWPQEDDSMRRAAASQLAVQAAAAAAAQNPALAASPPTGPNHSGGSGSGSAEEQAGRANLQMRISMEVDDSKSISALLKAAGEQLSEAVITFMITSYRYAANEGRQIVTDRDMVQALRQCFLCLRRIFVLILHVKPGREPLPESINKLLNAGAKSIDEAKAEPQIDQHIVEAAVGPAIPYIETLLRKQQYNISNSLRVLTIHLLAAMHSYNDNQMSHHILLQIGSAARTVVETATRVLNCSATYRHVVDFCERRKDAPPVDLANVLSAVENSVNIWQEKSSPTQQKYDWELELEQLDSATPEPKQLQVGSFNKLVSTLTSYKSLDAEFMRTFITTYRSFANPWQLFEKLCQRYNVPEGVPKEKALPIKLRVSVVIKYWVENHFDDFEEELVRRLFTFIDSTLVADNQSHLAKQLRNFVSNRVEERNQKYQKVFNIPPTDLSIPAGSRCPSDLFAALNDEEIARQVTLIDFQMFQSIGPSELLNQSWNKEKLKHRAPTITQYLGRLNRVSYWIASLIIWQEKPPDRVNMIMKLIHVGDLLRRMNNFHTLMAIVAALNNASVQRLKATRAQVPPKMLQTWKEIERLMHPQGSFGEFRRALKKCKPPVLPYLGMYLTDLTFIDDGNPDTIDGKINWTKRDLTYRVLQEIANAQSTPYTFPPVEPIKTFLTELPSVGEKELYELSLRLEGRDKAEKS